MLITVKRKRLDFMTKLREVNIDYKKIQGQHVYRVPYATFYKKLQINESGYTNWTGRKMELLLLKKRHHL